MEGRIVLAFGFNTMKSKDVLDKLVQSLPEYFPRSELGSLTHKVFSGNYIRNLMSKGVGPAGTRVGNKVIIFRTDFAAWLNAKYDSSK